VFIEPLPCNALSKSVTLYLLLLLLLLKSVRKTLQGKSRSQVIREGIEVEKTIKDQTDEK
jgi:hypothetical protein